MTVPVLDLDPYAEDALRSPYGTQNTVRDAGPVVWLSRHECYASARHAVVARALQDYAHFTSTAGVGLANLHQPGSWRTPSPLVESDPPTHTGMRKALERILSPRVIRSWHEAFAHAARDLCERVLARREFDGFQDLAFAYVQQVFPRVLGIAPDPRHFQIVGRHNANAAGPKNALFEQSARELDTIMTWYQWSQTPEALLPGGFGAQIFEAERAGDLPAGTAGPIMRTLVRGGLDTTISGISSTLYYLARNPDQWAQLRAEPTLALGAFEEALRLESPTNAVYRTTAGPVDVESVELRGGEKLLMMIGGANRDPRVWPDADTYRIQRRAPNAVIFGFGAHHCLGQRTARLEAQCLLTEFVSRVRSIEIAGEPRWQAVNALRSLESLPLRVELH